MYVSVECKSSLYIETRKDIAKLVKWSKKYASKYYDIIGQVDGCVLVTRDTPAWCTFQSINTIGDVEELEVKITNLELSLQLYELASIAKGFECTVEVFETNPVGVHPYFMFTKKRNTFCVVINRDKTVDIHVTDKSN